MKDNTVNVNGIDVYIHDIYYYADDYIDNVLELSRDDKDYIQTVSENFVGMILYIHDNIQKPSNDNIELLDSIFNIYIRLCSKYRVLPTLECFSFLVGVERRTFTDWSNGKTRASTHSDTVKKWFDTCKSFTLNRLHNQRGTDANLIFVAKAAYGMAETTPIQSEQMEHIPRASREEIAARHANAELPQMPDLD